jgi:hypothetical protein
VLKAEGVADFMRGHELEQPAHQVIGERQLAGARIERAGLHEVPIPLEVHDVVIELDVGVQDLAGPWISDVRA